MTFARSAVFRAALVLAALASLAASRGAERAHAADAVVAPEARGPAAPCQLVNVPLPADVRVMPPAAALDPKVVALSGSWEGQWDGSRPARLVVESVDATKAVVAYGIVAADAARHDATIEPDGALRFEASGVVLRFALAKDGRTLDGVHMVDGVPDGTVRMTRCAFAAK
jgi:hypothetical protein